MASDNKTDILIAKFFSGEALPEEAMELEDWVKLSPENKSYFNNCSKIFALTKDITYDDKRSAWKKINDTIYNEEIKPKSAMINWRLAGIAASVVPILAIGLLINHYNKKENSIIVYKAEAISKTISLKDKSEITVLPNSSITIDKGYGVSNRKLKLNGSAVFSVIHNPSQALIIDVNTFHIKDIGTRFTVVIFPASDTIFITVSEGEIAVYDDFGSSGKASAGENVVYIKSTKRLHVFHVKNAVVITTPKPDERNGRAKKPDSTKKIHPIAPPDTTVKNNYYPSPYPLDEGYTARGRNERRLKDSIETARITVDLLKDGLITDGQPLSFKLSDTAFILNGKIQSAPAFQRYHEKYVPAGKAGKGWVWSHLANMPAKQ